MSSTIRTPWPSRSALHHWIASQIDGSPKRLAGMDREVPVLAGHELERVEVAGRRMARLAAGDVESGDALVAVAHREFGDLPGARRRAHRGQQHAGREPGAAGALPESLQHRFDDRGQFEGVDVQLRSESDLGVNDAVSRQILRAFARDPHQRVLGLHDRDGVGERFQIAIQRTRGGGRGMEPLRQPGDIRGGEPGVPGMFRQFGHSPRPQSPVQMIVQEDLRSLAEQPFARYRHEVNAIRTRVSSSRTRTLPAPNISVARKPSAMSWNPEAFAQAKTPGTRHEGG